MRWVWIGFLLAFIAGFAILEGYALSRPDGLTLSQFIVDATYAWPPIVFILGFVIGLLVSHFWWPWLPKQKRETCQVCGKATLPLLALIVIASIALPSRAAADARFEACREHLPYGVPILTVDANTTAICHAGYAVLHDDDRLVPRWVAYTLKGAHTLGCEQRANNFHPDPNLPADRRAKPSDYSRSGYDRGHQAPAADFVRSKALMSDSFSMANMAPQLPGLNRKQWERLEETTRAWAWQRGELAITVGPVLAKRPRVIGVNHVAVPKSFWKVVVDTASNDAIAFVMPQRDIDKGKLDPWLTAIADVEQAASIALPLPQGIDRDDEPELWPADVKRWNAKRKAQCAR